MSQLQTVRMTNSLDSKGVFAQKLSDRLSVRIYRDCGLNYFETGTLQKGLVQMLDGEELIEEGWVLVFQSLNTWIRHFFPAKQMCQSEKSDMILC